jgi:hypothetical protein
MDKSGTTPTNNYPFKSAKRIMTQPLYINKCIHILYENIIKNNL